MRMQRARERVHRQQEKVDIANKVEITKKLMTYTQKLLKLQKEDVIKRIHK